MSPSVVKCEFYCSLKGRLSPIKTLSATLSARKLKFRSRAICRTRPRTAGGWGAAAAAVLRGQHAAAPRNGLPATCVMSCCCLLPPERRCERTLCCGGWLVGCWLVARSISGCREREKTTERAGQNHAPRPREESFLHRTHHDPFVSHHGPLLHRFPCSPLFRLLCTTAENGHEYIQTAVNLSCKSCDVR